MTASRFTLALGAMSGPATETDPSLWTIFTEPVQNIAVHNISVH